MKMLKLPDEDDSKAEIDITKESRDRAHDLVEIVVMNDHIVVQRAVMVSTIEEFPTSDHTTGKDLIVCSLRHTLFKAMSSEQVLDEIKCMFPDTLFRFRAVPPTHFRQVLTCLGHVDEEDDGDD